MIRAPESSPRILGVVFDLDGTLVDSKLDFQAMRREMGLGPEPILESMEKLPEVRRRECEAILERHETAGADCATLIPGAAEWLAFLTQRSIPRAICSRNSRRIVQRTLERVGLRFGDLVAREDAVPKPDPAGVLSLCERWRLPPAQVLVIGDYLYDLQAARAAGAVSALVHRGRDWPFAAMADHVWADLREGLDVARDWFA